MQGAGGKARGVATADGSATPTVCVWEDSVPGITNRLLRMTITRLPGLQYADQHDNDSFEPDRGALQLRWCQWSEGHTLWAQLPPQRLTRHARTAAGPRPRIPAQRPRAGGGGLLPGLISLSSDVPQAWPAASAPTKLHTGPRFINKTFVALQASQAERPLPAGLRAGQMQCCLLGLDPPEICWHLACPWSHI